MTDRKTSDQLYDDEVYDEIVKRLKEEMGFQDLSGIRPETVEYLKDLRPFELEELKEAISFARKTRTVSIFLKYIIYGVIGTIVTFSGLWDGIVKIKEFVIAAMFSAK